MEKPHTIRRRRRGRAMVLAIAASLAVGLGGIAIYAFAVPAPAPERTPADLGLATLLSFDITTTATGDLQARKQIELRSELDSDTTIVELPVTEGTMVNTGDILLRLNGDQIKSQVDEEALRVASAEAELVAAEKEYEIQISENDSKERQSKLKMDLAILALEQWEKGEVVQKKKDIELALAKADRDLRRMQEKHEQNEKLLSEGFLSKDQYDQDYIKLLEADAALQKAKLEEETYGTYEHPKDKKSKESDVEEARAEWERVKQENNIQLTIKDASRLNQRRQAQIRKDRLAKLEQQLAACTIKAPSAGLVVFASSAGRGWMMDDQPFMVGRRVMPRESLIVLPDTSEMMAVVKVHESLAGRIRPGQEATVKIDMLGGQVFSGKVDQIGVMAETSDRWRDPNRREYSVKIVLDHAGQLSLRPSMRCEAIISLGRVENTLAVPIQGVFAEEQLRYTYVPRGSKYTRVPVKVGRRSDTFAEIQAGLSAGTRVLLRQPAPGEIIDTAWDEAALKLVGFELGDNGKPRMIGGGPMAGRPDGPGEGMQRPGGPGPGGPGARQMGDGQRRGGPGGQGRTRPAGDQARREEKPKEGESAGGTDQAGTEATGGGGGPTQPTQGEAPAAETPKPRG